MFVKICCDHQGGNCYQNKFNLLQRLRSSATFAQVQIVCPTARARWSHTTAVPPAAALTAVLQCQSTWRLVASRLNRTSNPASKSRCVTAVTPHLSSARVSKGRHASWIAVIQITATVVQWPRSALP